MKKAKSTPFFVIAYIGIQFLLIAGHKMQVRVSYQNIAVGEGGIRNIDSDGGFVLFYDQIKQHFPPSVEHFKLPALAYGYNKSRKVTELTMEVLKDLEKG